MPYLVIKSGRDEMSRRELGDSLVIGRDPSCGLTIRDILLSRRHCKIEETPQGFVVSDLGSKNGTIVNGEKLTEPRVIRDTDVVRIGRCKIIFHAGALDDADELDQLMAAARPADPNEALSGTLTGFTLLMPGETENPDNLPAPNPKPREPAAYESGEVRSLLNAIASSSWDSIYAEAREQKARPGSEKDEEAPRKRRARPMSPIDLSLQVSAGKAENDEELPAKTSPEPIQAAAAPAEPEIEIEPVASSIEILPPPPGHAAGEGRPFKGAWKEKAKRWRLPAGIAAALAVGIGAFCWFNGSIPASPKPLPIGPDPIAKGIDIPPPTIVVGLNSFNDLDLPISLPSVDDLSKATFDFGSHALRDARGSQAPGGAMAGNPAGNAIAGAWK